MKYGFIGCGNVGGALATALAQSTRDILICNRSTSASVAERLRCRAGTAYEVAQNCDRIFIGVKPHMVRDVLLPLQEILAERKPLLISMAAGLTVSTLENYAGTSLPILRIMPNTPVTLGKGMTAYTANDLVDPRILSDFLSDMAPAGLWEETREDLMDTVAALSGSGPAYTYYFAEAMCQGAVRCGMEPEAALRYTVQTLEGAAAMLKKGDHTPQQLRIAVCSPGGSTLSGLKALDDGNFAELVAACIKAAHDRNIELGKM
ncbi:MAG: pyrroline-5-carboxylate reductase [Ruminococcaceae bacterium]|nr:pyrroline-5-carboxylate reductase [Oscillospiraceae bacterium]